MIRWQIRYLVGFLDRHPLLGEFMCKRVHSQLDTGGHHLCRHCHHRFDLTGGAGVVVFAHLFHLCRGRERVVGKREGQWKREGVGGG